MRHVNLCVECRINNRFDSIDRLREICVERSPPYRHSIRAWFSRSAITSYPGIHIVSSGTIGDQSQNLRGASEQRGTVDDIYSHPLHPHVCDVRILLGAGRLAHARPCLLKPPVIDLNPTNPLHLHLMNDMTAIIRSWSPNYLSAV